MRARMAIAASGVQVELREVVLRDKPSEMLEVSPKGTVPVLALPDRKVLEESIEIMHWALGQNDPENWLAYVDDAFILANDGPFKHALDRYKYPHRYGLRDGLEHRDEGLSFLTRLNGALYDVRFLGGEQRGFNDIALFPFVRQFAATDRAWFDDLPMPALQRWLGDLMRSELFAHSMTRYPQWRVGDEPTLFG